MKDLIAKERVKYMDNVRNIAYPKGIFYGTMISKFYADRSNHSFISFMLGWPTLSTQFHTTVKSLI